MPHDTNNNFALLFLSAVFALPLLFALFAPMAAAQGESADVAGYEIYGSVEEEAKNLRMRAEELRVKGDGFRQQAENDEAEAGRLKARADILLTEARKLDESAQNAREHMTAAKNQSASNRELAKALERSVGQWVCHMRAPGIAAEKWLRLPEARAGKIDVEAAGRHGKTSVAFNVFPNYNFTARLVQIYEYTFTRRVKFESRDNNIYRFQIKDARALIGSFDGKWRMLRKDGGRLSFEGGKMLARIDDLDDSETTNVELDNFILPDKRVDNWNSIPDLRAEALYTRKKANAIFQPPQKDEQETENIAPSSYSFSWWLRNCKKGA